MIEGFTYDLPPSIFSHLVIYTQYNFPFHTRFPPVKRLVSVCLRVKEPTKPSGGPNQPVINGPRFIRIDVGLTKLLPSIDLGSFFGGRNFRRFFFFFFPRFFFLEEPIFDGSFLF